MLMTMLENSVDTLFPSVYFSNFGFGLYLVFIFRYWSLQHNKNL